MARVCTLAKYRGPIAGSSGILLFLLLGLHRELLSHRCFSKPSELLRNPRFQALLQRGTRKAQDSFGARTQRYATRHNPKPCSRQPCAAPPRKAGAS